MRISSQGKCFFCQKTISKAGITRHLQTHLAEKAINNKPGISYHIKVITNPKWGNSPYFLHLWVNGNTTMKTIDSFLRQIWLECCGHMSVFRMPRNKRNGIMNFRPEMDEEGYPTLFDDEILMNKKAKTIMYKDLIVEYEYDFGSTTELQLTVVEQFRVAADQPLVLLSRNEPPLLPCEMCGKKPATQLCTVCQDKNTFCDGCAKKHAKKCDDFADYSSMPVVNSPRMGTCDYRGGSIDKERD